MKNIISTALFIALFPLLTFSQQEGDNRLIVSLTDTVNVLDRVDSILKAEGYKLDHTYRKSLSITTKPQFVGKGKNEILSIFSFALSKKNTLIIESFGQNESMFERWKPGMYGKAAYKRASGAQPWNEMDRLAKLFGTVTYIKYERK